MPNPQKMMSGIADGYDDALKQKQGKPIDVQATLRSAANLSPGQAPADASIDRVPATQGDYRNLSKDEMDELHDLLKSGKQLDDPRVHELHMKYMGRGP